MSRYQLPPRVAPSPAAKEPGLQNAASRLRSSRDAQARILAERRGETDRIEESAGKEEGVTGRVTTEVESAPGTSGGVPAGQVASRSSPTPLIKPEQSRKEKLVVMFKLAVAVEERIGELPGTEGVSKDYVLKALAKEGRAVLRRLASRDDLAPFVQLAKEFRKLGFREKTIGESMTVYVRPEVIAMMHAVLEDPWIIEPKATVVGIFFAAIVTRLIETRRGKS